MIEAQAQSGSMAMQANKRFMIPPERKLK